MDGFDETSFRHENIMKFPFLLEGLAKSWPAMKWTVDELGEILGEKHLRCRVTPLNKGLRDHLRLRSQSESSKSNTKAKAKKGSPVWESEGVYVECTVQHFNDWCLERAGKDNPLAPFSKAFSAYIDYKYLKDVFAEHPDKLEEVWWKALGLERVDGQQSTIWIGSCGASTPCHYDTYGFNLVLQIQGRKQWILFPPSDSEFMYPTRIPYEESSVFSQIDLGSPDVKRFPQFKNSHPIVVTLQPGQILYVPRHWWHYVYCTEMAVSINTWVELPEDNASRLHEAVTRVLASSLIPYFSQTSGPDSEEDWINPTEELESASSNLEYLHTVLGFHNTDFGSTPFKTSKPQSPSYLLSSPRLLQVYKALIGYSAVTVSSPFSLSEWQKEMRRQHDQFEKAAPLSSIISAAHDHSLDQKVFIQRTSTKRKISDAGLCDSDHLGKKSVADCENGTGLLGQSLFSVGLKPQTENDQSSCVAACDMLSQSDCCERGKDDCTGQEDKAIIFILKTCSVQSYLNMLSLEVTDLSDSGSDTEHLQSLPLYKSVDKQKIQSSRQNLISSENREHTVHIKNIDIDSTPSDNIAGDIDKQDSIFYYEEAMEQPTQSASKLVFSIDEDLASGICDGATSSKPFCQWEVDLNSSFLQLGDIQNVKGNLEEVMLKSILHPEVITLITQKLLQHIHKDSCLETL